MGSTTSREICFSVLSIGLPRPIGTFLVIVPAAPFPFYLQGTRSTTRLRDFFTVVSFSTCACSSQVTVRTLSSHSRCPNRFYVSCLQPLRGWLTRSMSPGFLFYLGLVNFHVQKLRQTEASSSLPTVRRPKRRIFPPLRYAVPQPGSRGTADVAPPSRYKQLPKGPKSMVS